MPDSAWLVFEVEENVVAPTTQWPKEEFEFSSLPGKFFLIFAFGDEANGNKAKTTRKYAFDLTLK